MAVPLEFVEGDTEPVTDRLLLDNVATESLAGHTVTCLLWDKDGALLVDMGTTTIIDAATRTVKFTPGVGKLREADSPLKQRWRVARPTGEVYHHPNAAPEKWIVRKP